MRYVAVDDLEEGMFLARNVLSNTGVLLFKEGVDCSTSKQVLKDAGVYTVYVTDSLVEHVFKDVNKSELMEETAPILELKFRDRLVVDLNKTVSNFLKSTDIGRTSENSVLFMNRMKHIANTIVSEVYNKRDARINNISAKNLDLYEGMHAIDTATLAVLLGYHMGFSANDLNILAIGALLMDIGRDEEIHSMISKTEQLSNEELMLVHRHPEIGRKLLMDKSDMNMKIKNIVYNHHERLNGSGYPRNLKGYDIDNFTRIVMLVDVYDALTSDRPYRKAYHPKEALDIIADMANKGELDFDLTSMFIRKVVSYPVGSCVLLSNGSKAVVTATNKDLPLRPDVRVVRCKSLNVREGVDTMPVILSKHPDLKIIETLPSVK